MAVPAPQLPAGGGALRTLSLCSGYGGLDLGVWLATGRQARAVCYVEREAFAAAILVAQMGAGNLDEAPVWSDLQSFDARLWRGAVDLVTAGIPCQPFSLAGKRRGRDDERWIGPDVLRIVRRSGARALFLEEVPAFATSGLPAIVQTLEAWGWRWAAVRVAAEDCGGAQERVRLFVLAMAGTDGFGRISQWGGGLLDGERAPYRDDADGRSGADVACTDGEGQQGRQRDPEDPAEVRDGLTGGPGGEVGGLPCRQRDGQRRSASELEGATRVPSGRAGLPYAPPGRDPALWRDIPAGLVPAEPTLCRMVAGVAGRLDKPKFPHWAHRMVAWRVLSERLGL